MRAFSGAVRTLILAAGLSCGVRAAISQELVPVRNGPAPTENSEEEAKSKTEFRPFEFSGSNGMHLPYRLLSPKTVEAGLRYPLVLSLHGSGAIGKDNSSQLGKFALIWNEGESSKRFPAFVLAPQVPIRTANYQPSAEDGLLASHPSDALSAVLELVEEIAAKYPVDRDRIYITGFSMGASTGWHSLLLRPNLFAAAVLVSGVPPERSTASRLLAFPILMTHGNADEQNPIAPDRAMFAALQRAGAKRLRFREYDQLKHAIPTDILDSTQTGDWWREWLFAQHRNPKPAEMK